MCGVSDRVDGRGRYFPILGVEFKCLVAEDKPKITIGAEREPNHGSRQIWAALEPPRQNSRLPSDSLAGAVGGG